MRPFLLLISTLFLLPTAISQGVFYPALDSLLDPAKMPFPFGVASGDPAPDQVVLWTKVYPTAHGPQKVQWQLAADTLMQQIVATGTVETDSTSAYTVKLVADGLVPGTYYFYRFQNTGRWSPIGRTKTAQSGDPSKLRLAVVSCSDYQGGYFNAYGHLSKQVDIDAVVHLGDYIYENGSWKMGRNRMMKNIFRTHIPDRTCTSIMDYRTRYAQYRADPQLAECHRLHPFIVIWDDHEIANNSTVAGTEGNPNGGPAWEKRKAVARQAYFEWLPIKDNPERRIARKFSFGKLAELWMLDGRLEGRSPQAKGPNDPTLPAADRHMLGRSQTEWLLNGMVDSPAKWKVIGNQVIFSHLNDSKVFDRRPSVRMDRWDGYPAERQQIFDFIREKDLKNIVVVTGDVHTSWAFDLTANPNDPAQYDPKSGKGVVGAEFVTPSISSFNFDEVVPKVVTAEAKRRFKKNSNNPHLQYVDLNHHGYFILNLTPEKAQADWYYIKRKDEVDGRGKLGASRHIFLNGKGLEK